MTPTKTPLKVDPAVLAELLDGRWAEQRRRARSLAADPAAVAQDTAELGELREATLEGVRALADSGATRLALPRSRGGHNDHAGYVAGFEETVAASPSLQVKAGVQFGLFGGAIQHLGNAQQHEKWLEPAQNGALLGCFAMTEIGHGSDVASLGTTAVYDPAAEEFVIRTPFRAAAKEYIGNAAAHGQAAVVFAQLVTAGVDHGVHAFFVPIRDDSGRALPGITIEDDGRKGGLLGVDNGRLSFDSVRIPRANLLNRYGDVAADGTYTSPIDSPGRRFFTMLGTLVQGRVSLDGAAVVASKLGLDIAVRYALQRRQFTGASDTEEVVLMDYQQHQRRLMPLVAETYANALAHEVLLESFQRVFSGEDDSDEARQVLETQAAGFKATTTWAALDILQECREACGGAGFMSENRLTGLRADLDVYVTFEGDNTVLLQLVGKRLLQDYSAEFANIDVGGVARFLGTQAAEHSLYRSGLANAGRTIGELLTPALNEKRIRSGRLQQVLLSSRVDAMVAELAGRLRPAAKMSKAAAAELFNEQQHELINAARAYVELLKWESLNRAMHTFDNRPEHADEAKTLRRIRDLYGLTLIERSIGWHIMYGRLSMNRARQVGPTINRLCAKLAGNAGELVAAFGYGPEQRRATIAEGIEQQRQDEAREYYRQARARADYPVDEKVLYQQSRQQTSARR
jgi:acyl-CoA oxidase